MKLYFVANSISHYKRLTGEYSSLGVRRILLNFKEIAKLKQFKFDPKIEYFIDSGASEFQVPKIHGVFKEKELDNYVEQYGKFIKATCHLKNVVFYAEMDVDNVYGYNKCKEWREYLSNISYKVSPVWHPSREKDENSLDEWMSYCERYRWISFGGSWKLGIPERIKLAMVKYAYEHKVRVHAMGCTSLPRLAAVPYYSVDSSSWLESEEHGIIPKFDFISMRCIRKNYKKTDMKALDYRERTRRTILEYLRLEKGITDLWLSRGLDWSKIDDETGFYK